MVVPERFVAFVAVAALPVMLIAQLPEAPLPVVDGTPRAVCAPDCVVAPVPPFAIATVPVTLDAVPVVFWFNVGMSAAVRERNVGAPDDPLGDANTKFDAFDAYGFRVSP